MNDSRIILENDIFYEETVARKTIGHKSSVLMSLATSSELKHLGPMFYIRNPLHMIPGQPKEKLVEVFDSSEQTVYAIECNNIPWSCYYKPVNNGGELTMVPSIRDRTPDEGAVKLSQTFNFPIEWGRLVAFFDCPIVSGRKHTLQDIFVVWLPAAGTGLGKTAYRTGFPNHYDDGRICLGTIPRRDQHRAEPDQEFVEFMWEYMWTSNYNRDLSFYSSWMTLDKDMNPKPMLETFAGDDPCQSFRGGLAGRIDPIYIRDDYTVAGYAQKYVTATQ